MTRSSRHLTTLSLLALLFLALACSSSGGASRFEEDAPAGDSGGEDVGVDAGGDGSDGCVPDPCRSDPLTQCVSGACECVHGDFAGGCCQPNAACSAPSGVVTLGLDDGLIFDGEQVVPQAEVFSVDLIAYKSGLTLDLKSGIPAGSGDHLPLIWFRDELGRGQVFETIDEVPETWPVEEHVNGFVHDPVPGNALILHNLASVVSPTVVWVSAVGMEGNVTTSVTLEYRGVCCVPYCTQRACGDDGYGGSCGSCPGKGRCVDGACCAQQCEGKECGDDGCGGECGACDDALDCTTESCVAGQCFSAIPSSSCVIDDACVDVGTLQPDDPCQGCRPTYAQQAWSALDDGTICGAGAFCVGGACCDPVAACAGKVCGPDGCGGFCGAAGDGACAGPQDACEDGLCVCQPACDGKACGPDGCGGSCGAAGDGGCAVPGEVCLEDGSCCMTVCLDHDCGDDGCGGSCGTCAQGFCSDGVCTDACDGEPCGAVCCTAGVCHEGACCTPWCLGRDCGGDGCGGFCGETGDGSCAEPDDVCTILGECCTPDCEGKVCGSDGCAGKCGVCTDGDACLDGLCLPEVCASGEVQIADAGLEQAARAALGLTSGAIPLAQAQALTTLQADNLDITSLSGLECFTGLSELSIRYNDLVDLSPLSALHGLTALDLSFNDVVALGPLAGLSSLTSLSATGNQVTDVSALAGLTALDTLHLRQNQIGELGPLNGLVALSTLTLEGNPLISIDVLQELTALYYLHLSDTGLGDLDPLSGLTVLHTLFIVDNHVDDLAPLVANEGLGTGDVIHAGGNPIDCVNQAEHIATLKARGVTVNTDCP